MSKSSSLLVGGVLAFGCSSDSGGGAEVVEDPSLHACEHRDEAGTVLSAAETADEAPLLALSDEPYTIRLSPSASGFVRLETPASALLFAGTAGVVGSLSLNGTAGDALPEPAPNEFCPADIPEHWDLEIGTGVATITLDPAQGDEVWLSYSSADGHGH